MPRAHEVRDHALIDALEELTPVEFRGRVWRVVAEGRDVTRCSRSGGRWDDGTFDVLYTSKEPDCALAEMYFHLTRGQPVIPSKVTYNLFELRLEIRQALRLDADALGSLKVDMERFGALSWAERTTEYPRPQQVAETAHFLGLDGLLVPSARWPCENVIAFCDRLSPDAIEVVEDLGPVDWSGWPKQRSQGHEKRIGLRWQLELSSSAL